MKTENPKEEAGRKKCPMHLLSPSAMRETANALGHGAEKYKPRNYRAAGINATTYLGAILRHVTAWSDGEDLDPESGLSHIAHAAACCDILLDCMHTRMMNDDRSKVPTPEEAIDRMSRSVLTEVTPGKPVPCAPNPAYKDAPIEEIRGVFKKGKFLVDTVMTETRSYRLLKKGERLKVGDEIKSHNSSAWGPCHLFVNDTPYFVGVSPDCPEGQYRRRIKDIP